MFNPLNPRYLIYQPDWPSRLSRQANQLRSAQLRSQCLLSPPSTSSSSSPTELLIVARSTYQCRPVPPLRALLYVCMYVPPEPDHDHRAVEIILSLHLHLSGHLVRRDLRGIQNRSHAWWARQSTICDPEGGGHLGWSWSSSCSPSLPEWSCCRPWAGPTATLISIIVQGMLRSWCSPPRCCPSTRGRGAIQRERAEMRDTNALTSLSMYV